MKKIIIGFLALFVIFVVGAAIFIFTFDINSYKPQIENALREATGYHFSLKGQITVSRSFEPTVVVDNVEIKNAQGFTEPLLFSAQKAQISFDLKSLLKDVIIVHAIRLTDVNINLEIAQDGRNNWTPSGATGMPVAAPKPTLTKAAATGGKKTANVASILMTNVSVIYQNAKNNQKLYLKFPKLSVQQLVNFTGEVVYLKEKFSFSGSVKNLLAMLATQRNLNFSFDIQSSFAKGKISGVCRDLKACENDMTLNLNATGDNLQKAYSFFNSDSQNVPALEFSEQAAIRFLQSTLLVEGTFSFPKNGAYLSYNVEQNLVKTEGKGRFELEMTSPELAHIYGVEPFSVKSNYTLSADKVLEFSNISAMFDETDIDGVVRVFLAEPKPRLTASLRSHYFKLSNVLYRADKEQVASGDDATALVEENGTRKLFSAARIDFSVLDKVNADITLNIDNLGISNVFARYPQLYVNAQLTDKVLTVSVKEGSSFAGGNVVGQMLLNTAQAGLPVLDMAFVAQGLKVNQVNPWRKVLRSGDVNINLFLKSRGDSVATLLGNLNGDVLLTANQVDISSPVISDLFSKDSSSVSARISQELFIKCAVLNATVQEGVINLSKKTALETGKFNMIVDGDINLKQETLGLHFIPQLNKGTREDSLQNVMRGVALEGDFSNPKPRVEMDVTALIPSILTAKVSDKQAFLNAYTKKTVEDNSVCRMAMGTTTFKDIDAYFGRNKITEEVKKEEPVKEPVKATRAQKISRDFLNSLSDVLSQPVTSDAPQTPAPVVQ